MKTKTLKILTEFSLLKNKEILKKSIKDDELIDFLYEILDEYVNDKNSSMLREKVTAFKAGYKTIEKKLGYDAYKKNENNEKCFVEIKPKNIYFKKDVNKWSTKLDGGGNFTDFTWGKFNKIRKDNIKVLTSGFCEGQLLYIMQFDFNENDFTGKLRQQLLRKFPDKTKKKGEYLRSASFTAKDYLNSKSLYIVFKHHKLSKFKDMFSKKLYNFLIEKK